MDPNSPVPNFTSDDGKVAVSGAQWTLGLPALVFNAQYSGQRPGARLHYRALDAGGAVIAEGDTFGTMTPGLAIRQTIQFTPQTAPDVATIDLSIV